MGRVQTEHGKKINQTWEAGVGVGDEWGGMSEGGERERKRRGLLRDTKSLEGEDLGLGVG